MQGRLLATFCVLVSSALTYGQESPSNRSRQAKPFTLKQVWTLDATYADQKHGVMFNYPSVWKAGVGFGYHPPALSMSEGAKLIGGYGFEDGVGGVPQMASPYSGTSLEGFGIVYEAVPAESATACEARAQEIADDSEGGKMVVGGRTFSVRATFSGGMNQYWNGKLYTTFVAPNCYLFETGVAGSILAPEDGGGRPLKDAELRYIEAHLLDIVKTIRIELSPGK